MLGEPADTELPEETSTQRSNPEDPEPPCPVVHPGRLLAVHQTRVEVLYMKQRIKFEVEKDYAAALEICDELIDHQSKIVMRDVADEKVETSELAQLLFMKC